MLCYLSCPLLLTSALPCIALQMQWRVFRKGARECPCGLSAETALSNSVTCLQRETPFSKLTLPLFTPWPQVSLSHLINPHSSKGKQPHTFPSRGPRCIVDRLCTRAACTVGKRLAGKIELHLQKVIALEPSGALLWWDFFFSFTALQKPRLDLFTHHMELLWQVQFRHTQTC